MSGKLTASSFSVEGGITLEQPSFGMYLPTFASPMFTVANPVDILRSLLDGRLSEPQLDYLRYFPYSNASQAVANPNMKPLLDATNIEALTEVVALFKQYSFEDGIKYLSSYYEDGMQESLTWYLPCSFDVAKNFKHNYEISRYIPKDSAYDGKCERKGCKSTTFISYQRMVARADEAVPTFVRCLICNLEFRI